MRTRYRVELETREGVAALSRRLGDLALGPSTGIDDRASHHPDPGGRLWWLRDIGGGRTRMSTPWLDPEVDDAWSLSVMAAIGKVPSSGRSCSWRIEVETTGASDNELVAVSRRAQELLRAQLDECSARRDELHAHLGQLRLRRRELEMQVSQLRADLRALEESRRGLFAQLAQPPMD